MSLTHEQTLPATPGPVSPQGGAQSVAFNGRSPEPEAEPPLPVVRIHHNYYTITGTTAAALRSQMLQLGPMSHVEARQYDANTDWQVRWVYRYANGASGCAMTSVQGSVDVTYTLPEWKAPSTAPRSLVGEWNDYLANLQTHEAGHKDNGVNAGEEVLQALERLPAMSTCQALEATIQSTAHAIIARYNQRDIDYDQITQHGQTQGAIFPLYSTTVTGVPSLTW